MIVPVLSSPFWLDLAKQVVAFLQNVCDIPITDLVDIDFTENSVVCVLNSFGLAHATILVDINGAGHANRSV